MENVWAVAATVFGSLATIVAFSGNTYNAPLASVRSNWLNALTPRGWGAAILMVGSIGLFVLGVTVRNKDFANEKDNAAGRERQLQVQLDQSRQAIEDMAERSEAQARTLQQQLAKERDAGEQAALKLRRVTEESNRRSIEIARLTEQLHYLVSTPTIRFSLDTEGDNYSFFRLQNDGRDRLRNRELSEHAILNLRASALINGTKLSFSDELLVVDLLAHTSYDPEGPILYKWDITAAHQVLNEIENLALSRLSKDPNFSEAEVSMMLTYCTEISGTDQLNTPHSFTAVIRAFSGHPSTFQNVDTRKSSYGHCLENADRISVITDSSSFGRNKGALVERYVDMIVARLAI